MSYANKKTKGYIASVVGGLSNKHKIAIISTFLTEQLLGKV
jgi:hypothetical protein